MLRAQMLFAWYRACKPPHHTHVWCRHIVLLCIKALDNVSVPWKTQQTYLRLSTFWLLLQVCTVELQVCVHHKERSEDEYYDMAAFCGLSDRVYVALVDV